MAIKRAVLLSALLATGLTLPAAAQTAHLTFAAYAAGFNVLRLAVSIDFGPQGYSVALSGRTAGTLGALYHADWVSSVQGAWRGEAVAPARYESRGRWGGDPRHTLMDYTSGNPVLRVLDPPDDGYHLPVPPDLQRDTIDTLSAMAMLIHAASQTGRCESHARIFDGRRLSSIDARTAGQQSLPASARSSWQGEALRCDFVGRQLAGFPRDQSPREAGRLQQGAAWLARLTPGGPLLPVRVAFETRYFGAATLYLSGSFPGALPDPAQIP